MLVVPFIVVALCLPLLTSAKTINVCTYYDPASEVCMNWEQQQVSDDSPTGTANLGGNTAPSATSCAPGKFCPLAPVTGSTKLQTLYQSADNSASALADYINAVYIFSISVAGILAVLRISWAGYQYMASEMWTSKDHAKEILRESILGLLLLLATWIILQQINPQITRLNLNLGPVASVLPTPVSNPTPTPSLPAPQTRIEQLQQQQIDARNGKYTAAECNAAQQWLNAALGTDNQINNAVVVPILRARMANSRLTLSNDQLNIVQQAMQQGIITSDIQNILTGSQSQGVPLTTDQRALFTNQISNIQQQTLVNQATIASCAEGIKQ